MTSFEAVAACFADHLRRPSRTSALPLADELDRIGEFQRARSLREFAAQGDTYDLATWWETDASCHASMDLPAPQRLGQLWFDPLEVTFGLLTPWSGKSEEPVHFPVPGDFLDWVSLTPVTEWQLLGAHLVDTRIPAHSSQVAAEDTVAYCALFGKTTLDIGGWLQLRDGYGQEVFSRVWGDEEIEYGGGAATSGFFELNCFTDILRGTREELLRPDMVDEMEPFGYPFRTAASIQLGLYTDQGTIPRVWAD